MRGRVGDVSCMETWIKRIALIFAAFGGTVLATILAARILMPLLGREFDVDFARQVGWALSPLVIWLYVRTWERSDSGPALLCAPRKRISLGSSLGWTVGAAVCIASGIVGLKSILPKNQVVERQPGMQAFHEANLLITTNRKGIQHGNTPKAKELAGEFASRLKVARQQGIEARKTANVFSVSGGEFITYCHMTDDHCVFLVHVPDLRKFAVSAKDYIADAAMETALGVVAKSGVRPATVAVGLRGALFYDRALSASLDRESLVSSLQSDQVKGNDECQSFLAGYFNESPVSETAKSPPAATPSTAASPASLSASRVGVVNR